MPQAAAWLKGSSVRLECKKLNAPGAGMRESLSVRPALAIVAFTVEMLLAGSGIREEVAYHRRSAAE